MKNILLICAVIFTQSAKSQTSLYHPFPDSSAFWTIQGWACCWTDCPPPPTPNPVIADYNFSYYLNGDTIINSLAYHKVYKSAGTAHEHCSIGGTLNNWFNLNTEYAGSYRHDTTIKKVYFIYPLNLQECLLYDFSLNVGDTLKNSCTCGNFCFVSAIDSILIGNNYRRQFHFSGSAFSVIEGIGSTAGLIEPLIPFESGGTLTCFSQNGQPVYPDTFSPCYIFNAGVNEISNKNQTAYSISPNPFSTYTILRVDASFVNADLAIFNAFGNKVRQIRIHEKSVRINRNKLCNGIYFFKAINSRGFTISGKMIME